MIHYIDKDTLLKEIEKLKCNLCPDFYEYNYDAAKVELLEKIENFINTIKVKDVDFHKELLSFYRHTNDSGSEIALAKYFYELGLKEQKGKEI